ncbi:hypothetical protein HYV91_02605 [Candidatus Wolfebacteria bacterium]|nr:hypothetical protein [Candidatus Wolfebacteria bacterium]
MDKIIVVIAIGIAVIVAGIFAVRFFYNSAEEPGSAPATASPTPLVQVIPTPTSTPILTPKPAPAPIPKPTTVKPSNTSPNALDRIEAAIRAKLKR